MVRMSREPKKKRRNWLLRGALVLVLLLLGGTAAWCRWVYVQIESYADQGSVRRADAIGVLGAAEYDATALRRSRDARLDHALELYHCGIAPLIIT